MIQKEISFTRKSLLLIIVFLVSGQMIIAQEVITYIEQSQRMVSKAHEFMERLKKDEPFTFEEELHYFGFDYYYGLQLLIHEYGYFSGNKPLSEETVNSLKNKIKYSYLCELIRMHRDEILLSDTKKTRYAYGESVTLDSEGNLSSIIDPDPAGTYGIVFVVQKGRPMYDRSYKEYDYSKEKIVKMETKFYRYNGEWFFELNFPITVNGENLGEKIGFVVGEVKGTNVARSIYLRPDIKEKLTAHMESLGQYAPNSPNAPRKKRPPFSATVA